MKQWGKGRAGEWNIPFWIEPLVTCILQPRPTSHQRIQLWTHQIMNAPLSVASPWPNHLPKDLSLSTWVCWAISKPQPRLKLYSFLHLHMWFSSYSFSVWVPEGLGSHILCHFLSGHGDWVVTGLKPFISSHLCFLPFGNGTRNIKLFDQIYVRTFLQKSVLVHNTHVNSSVIVLLRYVLLVGLWSFFFHLLGNCSDKKIIWKILPIT